MKIDLLRKEVDEALQSATSLREVEQLRTRFLGRKGPIQGLMQDLRELPPEERRDAGRAINLLKGEVEGRFSELEERLRAAEELERLNSEQIDVTLPGRIGWVGRKHPAIQLMDELTDIFISMGFSVEYGPELETDYYNFEALNFPPDHPAREMQDTFYVSPEVLLRTQATNTQARVLERLEPPIRVVSPGRVFRNEDINPRSHIFFHQVDGFYVDEGVTIADLQATIRTFLVRLFGEEVVMRFRPSYFPFVEPGLEVDVRCTACGGEGCSLCKNAGWLEIMGTGMIHPAVLRTARIDPERYTGFAWGLGVDRLALLRYGIRDIRQLLSENDIRFLRQF